jgi:hypothetical protein
MAIEIITGNSLAEGLVVFQTKSGWSLSIEEAELIETKEAVEAAMARANADAAANRVVEPYAIEVTREAGGLIPVRLREKIRAAGPTTGNSKTAAPPAREEAA